MLAFLHTYFTPSMISLINRSLHFMLISVVIQPISLSIHPLSPYKNNVFVITLKWNHKPYFDFIAFPVVQCIYWTSHEEFWCHTVHDFACPEWETVLSYFAAQFFHVSHCWCCATGGYDMGMCIHVQLLVVVNPCAYLCA